MDEKFSNWLASHLEGDEEQAHELVNNELAKYFLIVWSIYEDKCFNRRVEVKKFDGFAGKLSKIMDVNLIDSYAEYFHDRYQDEDNKRHLVHRDKNDRFSKIINMNFMDLNNEEKFYLLIFVTYRYRNNIFHSNKGVASWLKFDEQIRKCITVLQQFVNVSNGN